MLTLDDVVAARERIAGAVYQSPCPYSLLLSRLTGTEIYCKLDHLQVTGSFKERGARNRLVQLPEAARRRGVIAASAGNHALALAFHGQRLGIPVTVVVPRWAPLTKVETCKTFGATVVLYGESFDEARRRALQICDERRLTYIHGFDDEQIIAGQGTLGLEVLEAVEDVDAVIVPVGGGGLISGVGLAIKSLRPGVRVIGVEAEHAPTLQASRRAGRVVRIEARPTLADGLAIAQVGDICFEMCQRYVDDVVLVDEPHIGRAILKLLELEKTLLEGAGATPLAAMMQHDLGLAGKKVVLVLCGGNIDITAVGRVIERGLADDGRLCRVTASIDDRPGGLARLTTTLAESGASVRQIHHDRNFADRDVARVYVECTLETRDRQHIRDVCALLVSRGIEVVACVP